MSAVPLADAWSETEPEHASCHVCGTDVTVGVDGHDAGVADDGRELFACPVCCNDEECQS